MTYNSTDYPRRGSLPWEEGRSHIAQSRRVLLIEDDDRVRRALRRLMTLDGHRVDAARDGAEGLELALATTPDVAFVDIRLPGIDGYEVGRRIRAALGSWMLLVTLTACGAEQDRRRSGEAGFDAHLVKPVPYEDLARLLGRARGRDR